MSERFERARRLVGDEGLERMARARVAVFGLGGVGGYALEALARSGVGHLLLVDGDVVEPSNINRQLLATEETVGMRKVDVARARVHSINPEAEVEARFERVDRSGARELLASAPDVVVDAIDTVGPKAHLLLAVLERGLVHVSCMGAGSRLGVGGITVADIAETSGCGLARKLRRLLHRHGVREGVRCVYSTERPLDRGRDETGRPRGTIAHVPGLLGLTAAGLVVADLLEGRLGRRDLEANRVPAARSPE